MHFPSATVEGILRGTLPPPLFPSCFQFTGTAELLFSGALRGFPSFPPPAKGPVLVSVHSSTQLTLPMPHIPVHSLVMRQSWEPGQGCLGASLPLIQPPPGPQPCKCIQLSLGELWGFCPILGCSYAASLCLHRFVCHYLCALCTEPGSTADGRRRASWAPAEALLCV